VASVASIVRGYLPARVGVPVTVPMLESERPGGIAVLAVKLYGGVPPAAEMSAA
jgi:hypothetical protein